MPRMQAFTNGDRYATTSPQPVHPTVEAAHLARETCQGVTTAGRCKRPAIAVFERSGGLVATCAAHMPA